MWHLLRNAERIGINVKGFTVMDDYLFAGVCYVVLAYFLFGVVLLVRYGFN